MISIIVAVSENNVIGKNNKLIWHLPEDMNYFKEKTTGHCVITGRKNYESIPEKFRPLPSRINIVVTRQKNYSAPGAIVAGTIEEAIKKANETNDDEIFIIGGADVFRQVLKMTDRIYLTKIYHEFEGDTFFPELKKEEWIKMSVAKGVVDEKNKYKHDFIIYEKRHTSI